MKFHQKRFQLHLYTLTLLIEFLWPMRWSNYLHYQQ